MKNQPWPNSHRGKIHLFFCEPIDGETKKYNIFGFPTQENRRELNLAILPYNCLTELFGHHIFGALKKLKDLFDFITDPKTKQSLLRRSYMNTYVFCRLTWRPFIAFSLQVMGFLSSNRFVIHYGKDVIGKVGFRDEGITISSSIPFEVSIAA